MRINTLHWKPSAVAALRDFYKQAILEMVTLPLTGDDHQSLRMLLQCALQQDSFPQFAYRVPWEERPDAGVRISLQWNQADRKDCRITFNVAYTIFPGLRPAEVARYAALIKRTADVGLKLELLASALIDADPYDREQVRAAEDRWHAQRQREGLSPGARKVLDKILNVASQHAALNTSTRLVVDLTGGEKRSFKRLDAFVTGEPQGDGDPLVFLKLLPPGLHLAQALNAEENTDA